MLLLYTDLGWPRGATRPKRALVFKFLDATVFTFYFFYFLYILTSRKTRITNHKMILTLSFNMESVFCCKLEMWCSYIIYPTDRQLSCLSKALSDGHNIVPA